MEIRVQDLSVPVPGKWPTDPQHDNEISEDRIWVDGCFDFAHHGALSSVLPDEPPTAEGR